MKKMVGLILTVIAVLSGCASAFESDDVSLFKKAVEVIG